MISLKRCHLWLDKFRLHFVALFMCIYCNSTVSNIFTNLIKIEYVSDFSIYYFLKAYYLWILPQKNKYLRVWQYSSVKVCLQAHFPGDTHVPPFLHFVLQIAETEKQSVLNYYLMHFIWFQKAFSLGRNMIPK